MSEILFSVDFVLTQKGESLLEAYNKWRNIADKKVCCDYALHCVVSWWSEKVSEEMGIIANEKGHNPYMLRSRLYLKYTKALHNIFQ